MALTPLMVAGISAAAAGAGQLPNLMKSDLEKDQEKRLAELRRKAEMGALGLTDQERSALSGRLRGRSQQAGEFAEGERNRLLAAGGATAGTALEQAVAADEMRAMREDQLQQQIEEQDLARKQEQREEISALAAAQGQYQQNRRGAVADIATTGLEAGLGAKMQADLMQVSNPKPSANSIAYLKSQGLTEDEAAGFYEMYKMNPRAMDMFKRLED